jgi:hypothetical protein
MAGRTTEFRVAMRPGKRLALTDTPDGKLQDLVETAKANIRAKGEYPFRVIKQQFSFEKTRLRGMVKNRCKVNVLAALSNLFLARRQLVACDSMIRGVVWPNEATHGCKAAKKGQDHLGWRQINP